MSLLKRGDFVRVKPNADFRPGQDGMVMQPDDDEAVGLLFGHDRNNRSALDLGITSTGLVEEWALEELDLSSVAH